MPKSAGNAIQKERHKMAKFCACSVCGHRHRISDLDALRAESELQSRIERRAFEIMGREDIGPVQAMNRAKKEMEK